MAVAARAHMGAIAVLAAEVHVAVAAGAYVGGCDGSSSRGTCGYVGSSSRGLVAAY